MSLSSDPFGPINELPGSNKGQRKRAPPPRPPPPKSTVSSNKNISIFGRKKKAPATAIVRPLPPSVNVPTGTLIDLNSPPQGDKKKTIFNSGSTSSLGSSHIESGFEDDFGSVLSSGTSSPWADQYSSTSDWPSPGNAPSPDLKEPFVASDIKPPSKLKAPPAPKHSGVGRTYCNPTIICVQPTSKPKPVRPPPPQVQTFDESSPPMPSIPPPPPPADILDIVSMYPQVPPRPPSRAVDEDEDESFCIAAYDYDSGHPDDLSIKAGDAIRRIQHINEEWMRGELNGRSGMFPANYVHIKVPPPDSRVISMTVICTYPFIAETWDDLSLKEGDIITVTKKINENWLFGSCDGKKGQFPANFVQDISELEDIK